MSKATLKPIVSKLREAIVKGVAGKLEKYGFDENGNICIEKPLSEYEATIKNNVVAFFEADGINCQEKYVDYIHRTSRTFMHILICFKLMEQRKLMSSMLEEILENNIYSEVIPNFTNVNPLAFDDFSIKYSKEIDELSESDDNKEEIEYYRFIFLMDKLTTAMSNRVPLLFKDYEYNLVHLDYDDLRVVLKLLSEIDSQEFLADDFLGWIYQYWIDVQDSEKKVSKKERGISTANLIYDLLLKQMEKDQSDNGEFYTPRWIVSFIVENALGDILGSKPVEKIKIIDPACGGGNFLVYVFDKLYIQYKEEHAEWNETQIVESIVSNNIYGADINKDALQVAAINIWFKAQTILCGNNIGLKANLYNVNILQTNSLYKWENDEGEYHQISLFDTLEDLNKRKYTAEDIGKQLTSRNFEREDAAKKFFSNRFDVVVMNPPFVEQREMDAETNKFLKDNYAGMHNNLISAFIYRALELLKNGGKLGMISSNTFFVLDSFWGIRKHIIDNSSIDVVVNLGKNVFDGPTVDSAITIYTKGGQRVIGEAFDLISSDASTLGQKLDGDILKSNRFNSYSINKNLIMKIDRLPFIYSLDKDLFKYVMDESLELKNFADVKQGMITGGNDKYLFYKWQIPKESIGVDFFPYVKGDGYSKFSNNIVHYIDWRNNGFDIKENARKKYGSETRTIKNQEYFFREAVTYSQISAPFKFSARYMKTGCIFDQKGCCIFPKDKQVDNFYLLGLMNSHFIDYILNKLNFTNSKAIIDIERLPYVDNNIELRDKVIELTKKLIILVEEYLSFDRQSDYFSKTPISYGLSEGAKNVEEAYEIYIGRIKQIECDCNLLQSKLDGYVYKIYGVNDRNSNMIENLFEQYRGDFEAQSLEYSVMEFIKECISDSITKKLYSKGEMVNLINSTIEERFDELNGSMIIEEISAILGKSISDLILNNINVNGKKLFYYGENSNFIKEPIIIGKKIGGKGKSKEVIFWASPLFLENFDINSKYAMQNEIRRLTDEVYLPKLQRIKEKLLEDTLSETQRGKICKDLDIISECVKNLENWKVVD